MSNSSILFQHNTLASLMAGLYKGTLPLEKLLEHGDLGIGTLDGIDGELIICDGKAYQAIGTGQQAEVIELSGNETVPYAAIVNHRADQRFDLNEPMDHELLKAQLESRFSSKNLFQSIKIKGHFKQMHVRMIPKSPIGKRFAEIANQQPEFTEEDISGTLVGFWTPELFHGVSVAGYHLHFISDDKTFGGHVMDFVCDHASVEIGHIDALVQDFPRQDANFKEASFNVEQLKNDISDSE
ncbi:acetolactate decarboxylase [Streptococcus uberis]|uniref:acetolactate decarboxylase n=1 Tax=Streptococcus uberis TaxID=1349 RepID=UPI0027DE82B8|nr:acetolactate decarboxylase [Streptococcus uberis]MCK1203233.1 acetolactate decarboxylase [Streptococcus uberis]MCK1253335.1 acetolactate decarboxylase [Streptococcus uberis]